MSSQKKIILNIVILIFATILISNNLFAQQRQQKPPQTPTSSQIAKMVKDLSAQLSLNDNQEADIHKLFIEHFEEAKEKMESKSGNRPSRDEMEALKTDFEKSVKKLLNEEQQDKFDEFMKNNMKQKGQQKQRRN